jgi:hypothetical protein
MNLIVPAMLSRELAIYFAPPIPLEDWSCGRFTSESLVGVGIGRQRALQEAVVEQAAVARVAAVESEGELVQVVVELGVADRALVGAKDPALDQRGDEMHVLQDHMGRVAADRHVGDDVAEAVAADVEVPLPAVGANLTAAGDVVEHEVSQRVLGDVGDPSHPYALGRLVALHGDHDDRLAGGATTASACPAGPDVAFIDLHDAREQLAPGQYRRATQLCSHAHAVW